MRTGVKLNVAADIALPAPKAERLQPPDPPWRDCDAANAGPRDRWQLQHQQVARRSSPASSWESRTQYRPPVGGRAVDRRQDLARDHVDGQEELASRGLRVGSRVPAHGCVGQSPMPGAKAPRLRYPGGG